MKYCKCIFLIVLFSTLNLFSQEKVTQHRVSKGETISEIAQQYNISTKAILELNPKAKKGIKYQTVLLIPTKIKKLKTISTTAIANDLPEKTHQVLPKETLYSIAKQYNIAIEDLYKINADLQKEGLRNGQIIKIPITVLEDFPATNKSEKTIEFRKSNISKKSIPKEESAVAIKAEERTENAIKGVEHEVLPKETLYSVAKKYGIKLSDLQKANPIVINKSIKAGQKIIVPVKEDANTILAAEKVLSLDKYQKAEIKQAPVLQQPVVENKTIESEKMISVPLQSPDDSKKLITQITHEVLPKESLYSIAKQYRITLSNLKKANSELGNKSLKVGQKIKIPVLADVNASLFAEKVAEAKEVKTEKELAVAPQTIRDIKNPETELTHEVLPKETKFGIAKRYGLTVTELQKQNPTISNKLLVGSMLKIRGSKLVEKEIAAANAKTLEAAFVNEKYKNKEINTLRDAGFVDQLILKASEHIGTRYRSGGTTSDGFDCSGLMCYTFSSYDIKLPRSSIEMASYGSKIDAENAQKGDLIFFKTRGSGRINHVGMVVEVLDGEIKFIHSATHGGVIISSTKESYYERNLAQINRVL